MRFKRKERELVNDSEVADFKKVDVTSDVDKGFGDAARGAILQRAGDPPDLAAVPTFGDPDFGFQKASTVTLP